MNSKRTNRFVAILNIVSIVAFYFFTFSIEYLMSSIMTGGENGGRSAYNSFIIDTLLRNIQNILPLMYSGIGAINIFGAIQNKKNKKICFWQLVFGIYYFWAGIEILFSLTNIEENIIEWINKILFGIVPIILAIINLILIKKHRQKVIQVISYILVIILSSLSLLDIIGIYWQIIAVIMQLIYIHFQDRNIEESKSRKIINTIIYYILQSILAIGFLAMVLLALLITKVNKEILKNELEQLYNNISSMQGVTSTEICIPIENNYKYGFISENGKEKIPCEYDRVSYFNEIEVNNSKYYLALAMKDNRYYILSKSNDFLQINNNLEKYIKNIYEYFNGSIIKNINQNENYRLAYLLSFEFFFKAFNASAEIKTSQQTIEPRNETNKISLTEKNSKYYYTSQNYSMLIEPIYDRLEEGKNYYDNYNEEENIYHVSSYETKYKVTISKTNEESQSSILYLPGIDEAESTLETYTNGYIAFKSEDSTRNGWIDLSGNKTTLSSEYEVKDIKNDKIILQISDTNENEEYDKDKKYELNFMIIDLKGNILLQTTALDIYDNLYLVKNGKKKMVLMDKDLDVISNEYDKIITNNQIDISENFSSYY